jgi:hypothetical protein
MLARPFCFEAKSQTKGKSRHEISRPAVQEAGAALAWALAGKMDPKPDHGAKSYRGSGRLAGHKALITGCDSGTGRAAAIVRAREKARCRHPQLSHRRAGCQGYRGDSGLGR